MNTQLFLDSIAKVWNARARMLGAPSIIPFRYLPLINPNVTYMLAVDTGSYFNRGREVHHVWHDLFRPLPLFAELAEWQRQARVRFSDVKGPDIGVSAGADWHCRDILGGPMGLKFGDWRVQ